MVNGCFRISDASGNGYMNSRVSVNNTDTPTSGPRSPASTHRGAPPRSLQRRPPTVKRELQPFAHNIRKNAARGGVATLADDIHLHVIDGTAVDQIEKTQLVRLVLAAGEWNQIGAFKRTYPS